MKQKLNCILLIDDDYPTNVYHKIIIDNVDCAEKVVACQSASKALDLLKTIQMNEEHLPDLIFLDINMPAMNGWDFLEAYKQLPVVHSSSVLMMLSTSNNVNDIKRAEEIEELSGFLSKPLSEEVMKEVIGTYFSNDNPNSNVRAGLEN